ncbi:helix-turn-helix domain-containing protein [Parabacteroides sp. PF5-6]|uniref:helix-turn-helix domain-containing protein n=1 Tax=Parabacteroides sp. PF5-6 TaxID=1742403 RepID=UPI002406D89A|nr:helix-turn-helix domain-containing protein [Parabacteroides sp. PF5-6]MDF9829502.1 YesN/AraC family two-component response regulator [Parabacteroides sp. PF5-6]
MEINRLAIPQAHEPDMNNTDFCVFCHYLYSSIQNNLSQEEIFEFFKQGPNYLENLILSKYKQTKNHRKSRPEELFDKFINILRKHCSTEHSIRFYADKLFVTSQYLSKVVKDVSGKTASAWIAEFVLLEAKALLIHTNLSIQEVGFNVGFADQSAFGKFFKKNTGITPKRFAMNTLPPN